MPWSDSFRRNLADILERNGLSQKELARRSGVHEVTISRILHGHIEPTLSTAEKLARGAGTTAEKILSEISPRRGKDPLTAA
jgi:transcriptional regulator with XRE-family HTH domain